MSTYSENCKTGKIGEGLVAKFLKERLPDCKVIFMQGKQNQRVYGDICLIKPNDRKIFIEVKTEKADFYKNFFLEDISNKKENKPGAMRYCQAHYLFYLFLLTNELYIMYLPNLQKWAYEDGKIKNYPLKLQKTNEQQNDTYGYCVPIDICRKLGNKIGFWETIL